MIAVGGDGTAANPGASDMRFKVMSAAYVFSIITTAFDVWPALMLAGVSTKLEIAGWCKVNLPVADDPSNVAVISTVAVGFGIVTYGHGIGIRMAGAFTGIVTEL